MPRRSPAQPQRCTGNHTHNSKIGAPLDAGRSQRTTRPYWTPVQPATRAAMGIGAGLHLQTKLCETVTLLAAFCVARGLIFKKKKKRLAAKQRTLILPNQPERLRGCHGLSSIHQAACSNSAHNGVPGRKTRRRKDNWWRPISQQGAEKRRAAGVVPEYQSHKVMRRACGVIL